MKKLFYLVLFGLILSFLLPLSVSAEEGKLDIPHRFTTLVCQH